MGSIDLIQIKITRVIPAPKWRVIRLLTRPWELSSYVPNIHEVKVIQKTRNVVQTKWRIVVNNIPINWVEEDTLALRNNAIHFKAVEGDLEEFHGTWQFQDHKRGTQATVHLYLNVGIPAIKEFANNVIQRIVATYFESILDALERRLFSIKYAGIKKGNVDKIAGFGVLGHFYNFNHLERCLKILNPNYKIPSREFLNALFHISPSFTMHEMDEFRSKTGEKTHGSFILCTFSPDMIAYDSQRVYAKVVGACKLAEKAGVGIVTLGGFASMVGERLGAQINDEVDIPITTGNTYTAALAIDGVQRAVQLFERDMSAMKVAIIGGTGDIGSACARVLVSRAKRLTVTGRTKSNLRAIGNELKKHRRAKIEATTDNFRAVKDADIVIAAANASSSILKMEWFKPGAIICDLGYPKNISYTAKRRDIFVFSGGLASLPTPIDTGVDMGVPCSDVCYGCFCEVIILALERRFEHYSYGRGNITMEKMDEIRKMAFKHGFIPAPFYWADREIKKDGIEEIKQILMKYV
jgi:predicted amino acid dehydrogenase/ribosome-associated toxin RatA of RatAB toxin-antitoxin module